MKILCSGFIGNTINNLISWPKLQNNKLKNNLYSEEEMIMIFVC